MRGFPFAGAFVGTATGLRLQIAEWHVEDSPCGQNYGALDEILQFANIPRPMVGDQSTHISDGTVSIV